MTAEHVVNLTPIIETNIQMALAEDLGPDGIDVTAQLIDPETTCRARIITREPMILAGKPWAQAVFRSVAPEAMQHWLHEDGDQLAAGDVLVELTGNARALMTAERTAMNFLQTLSGTATLANELAAELKGTQCELLDTRKTIPGLRMAQKYAVKIGGGSNHRIGLFDAFLIKENHIAACGSIAAAVSAARALHPTLKLEVEVETFAELDQALEAGADVVMLDNFSLEDMAKAAAQVAGRLKLEASGNVEKQSLRSIAATGVDYISMGALTKHVRAIDLSMRVIEDSSL